MTDLRTCCQRSLLDQETPEEHFPVCDARAEDPPAPALFDLPSPKTEEGGPLL